MTAKKYPHVQAAHINALAEEGTRQEMIEWLQSQWNEICYLREAINSAYERGIEEMQRIIDGDYEKVRATPYRNDGKPSKNDKCPHDLYFWEGCENCIDDALVAAIGRLRSLKDQG